MTDQPPTDDTETWTSRQLAVRIADLIDEKQGADTVVLEVGPAFQVTDFFVITQGQNKRHLSAIAEHVAKELKQDGLYRMGGSSLHDDDWVLLDFGVVVFHAFSAEARSYYDLENLWGECEKVDWLAESTVDRTVPEAVADDEDEEDDEPVASDTASDSASDSEATDSETTD